MRVIQGVPLRAEIARTSGRDIPGQTKQDGLICNLAVSRNMLYYDEKGLLESA